MGTTYRGKRTSSRQSRSNRLFTLGIGAAVCLLLVLCIYLLDRTPAQKQDASQDQSTLQDAVGDTAPQQTAQETDGETGGTAQEPDTTAPEADPQPEEDVWVDEPEPDSYPDFTPQAVESTLPSKYISTTEVLTGGQIVPGIQAADKIRFDTGSKYAQLDGIFAFRGDNFRSGSAFGVADIQEKRFGESWTQPVTSLSAPDGNFWSGCGWTGQPLLVTWPKETRQIMNLYDWAKEADTLTEVIYATMDGHVYFLELETGRATRDALNMGFTFKGAGSVDPRGYPVLYVGAGYVSNQGPARAFAISLIDFSTLFTFGNGDSFALRDWPCFDSSPLIDAETDQLIYPGENGILYLVKLNTAYDETAGTLTMEPDITRWRYQGVRSSTSSYWLGMEDSAVVWQGHLIMADNGGNLMCLDLDTLKLDWVQDVLDDTNCSPVLELEDGHPYVYIGTSFHLGWRSSSTADVPAMKVDAVTGEIVWQRDYTCYSENGVSGGIQGTMALGQKKMQDLVLVPVSRTGTSSGGIVTALDKATGETVWTYSSDSYTWGSPTIVYDKAGNGYVIFGTLMGTLCMLDGSTGELLDSKDMGAHMEATVAAYNDYIVVGTRTNYIYGIKLE